MIVFSSNRIKRELSENYSRHGGFSFSKSKCSYIENKSLIPNNPPNEFGIFTAAGKKVVNPP